MDDHQNTNPESVDASPKAASQDPASTVFFGVGCWDFGIRCQPSQEFSVESYTTALEERLEAISSLNNLNIATFWDDEAENMDLRHATKTDGGMAIFAKGIVSRIDFDLYIPFRIQNDLPALRVGFDTGTENFRVHILYQYYSPVVFVELLNPNDSCTPSTALVVIREYLRNELEKIRDLAFNCVGPTPFHADFSIGLGEIHSDDRIFEHTVLDSRGYSTIAFHYRPNSSLGSAQAALEQLMEEVGHEFDVYYFLCRQRSENYGAWEEIEGLLSDLISHSEHLGWWQRIWNMGSQSRSVRDLSVRLTQFQARQISDEYVTRKAFCDTYKKSMPFYVKTYVEGEMEDRFVFPTVPIGDLLGFFERRRSKTLELLAILAAAVIGGVAGSLVTILANQ